VVGSGEPMTGKNEVSRILRAGAAALGVLLLAGAAPAAGEAVGVAGFGLLGLRPDEDSEAVIDLEYRFRPRRYRLAPVVGGIASSDGTTYLRAGLGRDFPLHARWNAHVNLAAGAYFAGGGKDLGSSLEFRTAVELSYRLTQDLRLGITWAHLSNSDLGSMNPGLETLTLSVGWRQATAPIRRP
jgi:lipid A 3-O-deacylase